MRSTFWSSGRLAVPLTLAVVESAWASLLLNAAFYTSRGPRVQIGVLTLAIPTSVAVAVAALSPPAASRRRSWSWAVLRGVAVLAGAMVTAGIIAELAGSGSFWVVASHPWAVSGHQASAVVGTAWFLSVLTWVRGTWLGAAPPSSTHATSSIGLGGIAFVGVFAGRADTHASAFRAATGSAGWLLFLAFPCAAATLALIRQDELQKEVAPGARNGPGAVWLSVLTVPMLVTALVALLVAVTVGPAAPIVGRGLARAGKAVGWAVYDVAAALWHLIPKARSQPVRHPAERGGLPSATLPHPHATTGGDAVSVAIEIIIAVIGVALVVLVLVVLVGRVLKWFGRRRDQARAEMAEGETDSVFSWGHLGSQLWQALKSLFTRGRPGGAAPVPAAPVPEPGVVGLGTIRLAYRRVLTAAYIGGWPRSATETSRELQLRLGDGPAAGETEALAELTTLYHGVRYAERPSAEDLGAVAMARAEAIERALNDSAVASEPAPAVPLPSRS